MGAELDPKRFGRVARLSTRKWPIFWEDYKRLVVIEQLDKTYVRLPEGVILIQARERRPIPSDTKIAVTLRDTRKCVYCGTTSGPFHFDHLYPLSRGGSDDPCNLVVACQQCNISKSDRTLMEWVSAQSDT